MKRDILIITLWEIVGGLLLFASFWISRWGRCALAYDAPDWVFLLLFAAPIVIAVIFFGRLRTLFFLVLSYLLHHLFRIAIPIPEDIADSWDILVIILVSIFGFVFVAFSSCA